MMKTIPLGASLVMLIGPSGAGKSTLAEALFSKSEIVSTDEIRKELTGGVTRQDMDDIAFDEYYRRLRFRLEAGLRTVADATHLRRGARLRVASVALDMGLPVTYLVVANRSLLGRLNKNNAGWRADVRVGDKSLIEAQETTFQGVKADVLAGDGGRIKNVIQHGIDEYQVIKPLDRESPELSLVHKKWKGICAIGDIHGNVAGLKKAISYARNHHLFMIFLGDIVDYTIGTLHSMEIVGKCIESGEAISVMGNHEKKILNIIEKERTAAGYKGNISHGNAVTMNLLKAMSAEARYVWENRFIGWTRLMPHHIVIGDWLFTHGAATPYMFDDLCFRFPKNTQGESFAMYGQTTGNLVRGLPERIYDWIDEIPARKTVVVGHDIRSDIEPQIFLSKFGGRAIFLDTGSGKDKIEEDDGSHRAPNGHLSWIHVEFNRNGVLERIPTAYMSERDYEHG